MSDLRGDCRLVPCPVQHLHPRTGEPPDYHFRRTDGTYEPRWKRRKPMLKSEELLYSREEAAAVMNVSRRTISNMVRNGLLQSMRLGSSPRSPMRFRANWLRDAMAKLMPPR